jgi:hypothetical protein
MKFRCPECETVIDIDPLATTSTDLLKLHCCRHRMEEVEDDPVDDTEATEQSLPAGRKSLSH